jgi:hypothetical protein
MKMSKVNTKVLKFYNIITHIALSTVADASAEPQLLILDNRRWHGL